MDRIIFVFTNNGSIRSHFEVEVDDHNIDLNNHNIIKFKGIYLLSDKQSKEELKESWSSIEKIINGNENVHFIHHTKPDAAIIEFIREKGYKTYCGSHEGGIDGYQYYEPFKRLLTDDDFNEDEILKDWGNIFEKKSKTDIFLKLNQDICNYRKDSDSVTPERLKTDKAKAFYNEFKKLVDEGVHPLNCTTEQESILAKLRDELIPEDL